MARMDDADRERGLARIAELRAQLTGTPNPATHDSEPSASPSSTLEPVQETVVAESIEAAAGTAVPSSQPAVDAATASDDSLDASTWSIAAQLHAAAERDRLEAELAAVRAENVELRTTLARVLQWCAQALSGCSPPAT